MSTLRTCSRCGVPKPLADFDRSHGMPLGREYRCKLCMRAHRRAQYLKHEQRTREGIRDRHRAAYAAGVAWAVRQPPPERKAVYNAVHRAIRRGQLTRPATCPRCGRAGMIHAHHHDYSRPLDVHWLCVSCHRGEHRVAG